MRSFEEIMRETGDVFIDEENSFYAQDRFQSLTKEQKLDKFKEYLFRQAKLDPGYQPEMAEKLYRELEQGQDKLDAILGAIADKITDGVLVLRELQSRFLRDTVFQNTEGPVSEYTSYKREEYIKHINEGNTAYFHSVERKARVIKSNRILKEKGRELDDMTSKLEITGMLAGVNMDIGTYYRDKDLDKALEEQADTAAFMKELDEIEKRADAEERERRAEEEEIEELFPDNAYLSRDRLERARRRKEFTDAVDMPELKAPGYEEPKLNKMMTELGAMEEAPDSIPLTEEGMQQDITDRKDAEAFAAELDQGVKSAADEGEKAARKLEETAELEALFPENEGIKKGVQDRGHVLRPVDVPELSLEENLKSLDETGEELVFGDTGVRNQEIDRANLSDAQGAIDFVNGLDGKEKDTDRPYTPEAMELDDAFRELDRTEQLLLDQESFEKLSAARKLELSRKYLTDLARVDPRYTDATKDQVKEGVNSDAFTAAVSELCTYVKSGEHFLAELQGSSLQAIAYNRAFPDRFPHWMQRSGEEYSSVLRQISESEEKSHARYGTYNGKPKPAVPVAEEQELEELFPGNEANAERSADKARKEREEKDLKATERIRAKKDARREAVKRVEEEQKTNASAKHTGYDTLDEEIRHKMMSPEQAELEIREIKAKLCGPDYRSMNRKERMKLVRSLYFCKALREGELFGMDLDSGSMEEIQKKKDALHRSLKASPTLSMYLDEAGDKIINGSDFYTLINSSPFLFHVATGKVDRELKEHEQYDTGAELRSFKKDLKLILNKQESAETVRKNPKKADKGYDNYIILHTGPAGEKDDAKLLDDFFKVAAAEKLREEGKAFSTGAIHKAAERIRERVPKSMLGKEAFMRSIRTAIDDTNQVKEVMQDLNTAMFRVEPKNMEAYKEEITKIFNAMEKPEGRSDAYHRLYNNMKAITRIKMTGVTEDKRRARAVSQTLIRANAELYDAIQVYSIGKEKVHFWSNWKKRFDHALDALSAMARYAPGTIASTRSCLKRVNAKRTGKDRILSGSGRFSRSYGGARAQKQDRKSRKLPAAGK